MPNDLLSSTVEIYNDINQCISDLLDARLHKNDNEQKVLTQMESLMVSSLQQFGCIIDYLKEKV